MNQYDSPLEAVTDALSCIRPTTEDLQTARARLDMVDGNAITEQQWAGILEIKQFLTYAERYPERQQWVDVIAAWRRMAELIESLRANQPMTAAEKDERDFSAGAMDREARP